MITVKKSASFTRPANTTAYAAGDAVTASASAGVALQLLPNASLPAVLGDIVRVVVQKSTNTASNSALSLALFSGDPGAVNDNGAVSLSYATAQSIYLGSVA